MKSKKSKTRSLRLGKNGFIFLFPLIIIFLLVPPTLFYLDFFGPETWNSIDWSNDLSSSEHILNQITTNFPDKTLELFIDAREPFAGFANTDSKLYEETINAITDAIQVFQPSENHVKYYGFKYGDNRNGVSNNPVFEIGNREYFKSAASRPKSEPTSIFSEDFAPTGSILNPAVIGYIIKNFFQPEKLSVLITADLSLRVDSNVYENNGILPFANLEQRPFALFAITQKFKGKLDGGAFHEGNRTYYIIISSESYDAVLTFAGNLKKELDGINIAEEANDNETRVDYTYTVQYDPKSQFANTYTISANQNSNQFDIKYNKLRPSAIEIPGERLLYDLYLEADEEQNHDTDDMLSLENNPYLILPLNYIPINAAVEGSFSEADFIATNYNIYTLKKDGKITPMPEDIKLEEIFAVGSFDKNDSPDQITHNFKFELLNTDIFSEEKTGYVFTFDVVRASMEYQDSNIIAYHDSGNNRAASDKTFRLNTFLGSFITQATQNSQSATETIEHVAHYRVIIFKRSNK